MVNMKVDVDWKSISALGAAVVGIIFSLKMDAAAAERVSIHAIDAVKEYSNRYISGC